MYLRKKTAITLVVCALFAVYGEISQAVSPSQSVVNVSSLGAFQLALR